MTTIRLTLAVAWKELQVLLKDRGSILLLLLLPLVIAGLLNAPQIASWQNEGDAPEISLTLLIVNEDDGPYGEQVVAALQSIDILKLETVGAVETADQRVTDQEADAAVVIPAAFSQDIDAYVPTGLNVIVDPTQAELLGIVTGILDSVIAEVNIVGEIRYGIRSVLDESGVLANADPAMRQGIEAQTLGVIMTQLNDMRRSPAIAVVAEDMAGKTAADLLNLTIIAMMPGVAILFAFFVVTTLVDSFYVEKDQGSFRRLLASPLPRGSIIAGKMIAYMVIVFVQVGMLIGIANVLFKMPIGNSPGALLLVILLLALAVTAVGMLLVAVTRTQKQANAWAMVFAFVMGALGGTIHGIPIPFVYRSDGFLGTLSRLTPQGTAMEAFIRIMGEGAGMVDVLPQMGALLAMTVVLYLLALWRFRFD